MDGYAAMVLRFPSIWWWQKWLNGYHYHVYIISMLILFCSMIIMKCEILLACYYQDLFALQLDFAHLNRTYSVIALLNLLLCIYILQHDINHRSQ